jgi:outer membrane protein assembly factor BamB
MNKTRIIMVLVAIALTVSVASATDWSQFQKDEKNSGWTTDCGPQTAPDFEPTGNSWYRDLPDAGYSGIDTTPIVVGDFVYVLTADQSAAYLYKYHKDGSGSENGGYWTDNRTQVGTAGYMQLSNPTSDGSSTIFVANNKPATAGICAVDIATGTVNWNTLVTDGGNYAQANTPIVHHEDRIFFGTTYGTTDKYYCYWANNGTRCWARTCTSPGDGGYYWAGGAIIGEYLVFGDEYDILTSVYWCNGTTKDTLDVTTLPYSDGTRRTIRSSITWDGASGIYFTDKPSDGNAWKVGFDAATGMFDPSAGAGWRNPIGYTTSTPVVYNGRVYVGMGGFGASGNLYCLDASTGATIWTFAPNGGVQSSPVISTCGDEIHIYFTANCQQGRAYCVEDNGATGDEVWHFETFESGTSGGYILQGCAVSDGWAFFGNDGAGFYGLTDSSTVTEPDLDVTAIDHGTIYSNTYNIITATVENIGNGDAGTFNVTLGDSSSGTVDEVTVTGLAHGASTEVKLLWTPDPINYQLTVTADSNDEVDESDESNNVMTTVVYPIPVPPTDLIVTEVCDGDLFVNEDNVVFAVIENNGADASGFSVSLEVGGVEKDKVFVPMLYFRDSQIVTLSWTPTSAGNVQLDVTVDCDGQITESNEANNVASQNVGVVNPTVTTVSTIGALQAAASSGTNKKIVVNAGTYNGQVTIPTACSGIRLIANGAVTIADNTGDIVTVEGENCYVSGFQINGSWNGDTWPSWSSAGVNVTSDWNVVEDNYIYNTSGGIKLSGSKNLIKCNTVGDSALARACAKLMVTSGDLNAIVKNKFDGDTGYHGDHYGWVLGGIFTIAGVIEAEATNNLVRDNNFTITGVPGTTQFWPPGSLCFGGDPNLVFNNIINDTDPNMIWLGRLNWYSVDKVAVEDPMCGNVVHGPYYGGNHWLGYTGSDSNQDLLGDTDTPYRGYDAHPLVKAKCGDVDCSGATGAADLARLRAHLLLNVPMKNPWAGDVDFCSGAVSAADLARLRAHLLLNVPIGCCECGCGGA